MYLVHIPLTALGPGAELPAELAALLLSGTAPPKELEHISVHRHGHAGPVVGLYLVAPTLEHAEAEAAAFVRRALDELPALPALPALRGWTAGQAAAPLVAALYERLIASPTGPGRFGPGPLPST
ncbi:hypothetical protein [Kitasatospora purpeofusca]|uniref:hypothetical protein n=1 Tax=Kitasatospora purpeofusca TaxID=67352 RepID=UPI00068A6C6E|nr:hypothetical protein [Kitasatospora purpeofusca]